MRRDTNKWESSDNYDNFRQLFSTLKSMETASRTRNALGERMFETTWTTRDNFFKVRRPTGRRAWETGGGVSLLRFPSGFVGFLVAYSGLNPIEQLFINNDFFYEDYPDWWKELYSKSQYTRYMKRAIVHFLRLFYDED